MPGRGTARNRDEGVAMIGILCVVAGLALAAGETNDVDAVIQLVKSGASESLVVKTIRRAARAIR